ncbi:LuxR C-terminal-related transcriptional regulator [Intrasporangium mesophilum]
MGSVFGTRFVGRERELGVVRDLVSVNRVVTLAGFGGVGKTRLAARVVDELGPGFADGAFLVALADLTDTGLLGHTVAGALGLQVPGSGWDPAVLTDFLRERQVLLWLDNCEHLVDDVAPLVARLVRECPGVAVLATSRMPLGLAGEAVYEVPPMTVPPMDLPPAGVPEGSELSPEVLAGFDAVELFVDRARAASASFRLVRENAAAVAELVGVLDGVPLAVELAAARVRVAAPEVMVRRAHELRLLDGRRVDAPARHRSMVASVEWSYRLCPPQEQAVWRRLSVFVGGFDIEAAEAVCATPDLRSEDVLGLLMALSDKSVIAPDPDHAGRYRMLEPVRQYGAGQAEDARELAPARDAHLAWFEELTTDMWSHWSGPDQASWLARVRREHANLRAALEHAVADPDTSPAALRICRNLEPYWNCEGRFNEARHWMDLGLAQPSGSPPERSRAAAMAAWFAAPQLDHTYARARLDESLALLDTALASSDEDSREHIHPADKWKPDCYAPSDAMIASALVSLYDGRLDDAVEQLTTAAAELQRTGHAGGHSYLQTRYVVGLIRALQGDHVEATRLCSESLALSEARGEKYMRCTNLWVLGLIAFRTGQAATAEGHQRQAVRIASELQDKFQMAMGLEALGWTEAALGRGIPAAALLGAAKTHWQLINMPAVAAPFLAIRTTATTQAETAVGPEAYGTAFARGQAMDTSTAVAFAVEPAAHVPQQDHSAFAPLTPREADIAQLVADGLSNRQIAQKLVISERTVHGHIRNILTKLDATSRAKIASWYIQHTKPHPAPPADQPNGSSPQH